MSDEMMTAVKWFRKFAAQAFNHQAVVSVGDARMIVAYIDCLEADRSQCQPDRLVIAAQILAGLVGGQAGRLFDWTAAVEEAETLTDRLLAAHAERSK